MQVQHMRSYLCHRSHATKISIRACIHLFHCGFCFDNILNRIPINMSNTGFEITKEDVRNIESRESGKRSDGSVPADSEAAALQVSFPINVFCQTRSC